MKGLFITLEGVEGCGKTTQIALLRAYLEEQGCEVLLTREPGGTPIAEVIRDILLDPAHTALAARAELFLYEAARAQHVEEKIRPALMAGKVVICDRFIDSTTAYQGAGRGLAQEEVMYLHRVATGGVWPDLTLLLDLSAEEGLARAHARGRADRMEQEALDFHERVRAGFLALARQDPERITIVDARCSVDVVAAAVRDSVRPFLQRITSSVCDEGL